MRQCLATADDLSALAELLTAYMKETYDDTWHGSMEALQRDALGRECDIHVVEIEGRLIGFVAWQRSYGLHHCMTGGDILDLYVTPSFRGYGVAPALIWSAAAELYRCGGMFVKGGAVGNGTGEQLYARCAGSSYEA